MMISAGTRVVVTAGASGIGRVTAEKFIRESARVIVCDIDEAHLATFAAAHPQSACIRADVSCEGDVDRLFAAVADSFGGLDVLVNNAGISGPTAGIDAIAPEDWRRCIDVCLTGQFLCARRAVPLLRSAERGTIVNLSSVAGRLGYAYRTPYASAKWGVIGLTKSLAIELGPDNISVNAILPGVVEGERIDNVIRDRANHLGLAFEDVKKQYLGRVSLGRMIKPEEIADMILYLASPSGLGISGQAISVCGNVESI